MANKTKSPRVKKIFDLKPKQGVHVKYDDAQDLRSLRASVVNLERKYGYEYLTGRTSKGFSVWRIQ